jgi:hypothetical protein
VVFSLKLSEGNRTRSVGGRACDSTGGGLGDDASKMRCSSGRLVGLGNSMAHAV